MNIGDRHEALKFESELDRVKQERNRLRAGLEEKIAEWIACVESIAKLEAALQSVIDYEPVCLQAQGQETGMCMFECPTCVARKALGGMEMEETARLGRGEDPRTFGQEDKP